jgi:hypothetical protein
MCLGTPDMATVPERQSVKLPKGDVRDRSISDERRRRGMLSTILTSASGTAGPLSTTNVGAKTQLGV